MLDAVHDNIENTVFDRLIELCDSVYNGAVFDNDDYNEFVSYVQSLNL